VELHPFWYIAIFLLGLSFGSFFNVAIYRWPQEEAKEHEWVVTPSHCPKCGKAIRAYDNIPLLSYMILGGKCRDCKNPISIRYPIVELLTALLWVGVAWLTVNTGLTNVALANINGWHVFFAIYFASFFMLTLIIDLETGLIPDEISWGLLAGAVAFVAVLGPLTISGGWISSLIGMLPLSLLFYIFGRLEWMGYGDAKFCLGLGFMFGWPLVLAAGFMGILVGGAIAIVLLVVLIAQRKYEVGKIAIPFGPYLAIGGFAAMFWAWDLIHWYLSFFPKGQNVQLPGQTSGGV
jgi:leader peptidase (prepilin peptidase)/N-methyltransferase